ncbi:MAG: ABC transporter permease [Actinobacteria bacterium]|nr:ABC transporter permease [Actinomycetota bacterium]
MSQREQTASDPRMVPGRELPPAGTERLRRAFEQYTALSRRSIVGVLRKPTSFVPSLTFPLLFLALTSSALAKSIELPGFPPVDSFMQFAMATAVIQGTLFGSMSAGSAMAEDIEGGFFERLIASPVARTSIMAGRVGGAAFLGFMQAWLFLLIGSLFGVNVEGGFIGMLAIGTVAAILAAGIGSISVALALRTGSAEAVDGSFPLFFSLLFLSSAYFPRVLMDGWFRNAATANPLSHMIEGLRTIVIEGIDVMGLATALAIASGVLFVGLVAANLSLKRRLASVS